MEVRIVPAILSQTEEDFRRKMALMEDTAEVVHIDIMDGEFVPNKTIGAVAIEKFPTTLLCDVHLMVADPLSHLSEYSRLGVNTLIFHAEACHNNREEIAVVIEEIRSFGIRVGLALNLETSLTTAETFVPPLDLIQLMAVTPGFGGQNFSSQVLPRVVSLRKNYPNLPIAVDGGVNEGNIKSLIDSGATELAVGSSLFLAGDAKAYFKRLESLIS